MALTAITRLAARTALAARLADTSYVRWTAAELNRYLAEALRTWNAYTASYRSRGVFALAAQEPFYDLPTVIPDVCGFTLTNHDLLTDLEYALLEPPTPSTWTGSAQFTLDDLVGALTRRRDQFRWETSTVVTREILPGPSVVGRSELPARVLRLRRLAWRGPSAIVTPLRLDDEWAADHYSPAWPQQPVPVPRAASVAATPPLRVQFLPPPLDAGMLDAIYVAPGASLTAATATLLGVPDDWAWVIKWGALADLLSRDGLALDPARAAYCEARWQQGVDAATPARVVLSARINNIPCRVSSLADADNYSPLWQTVPGQPREVLTLGQTLLASWPPPGTPVSGGEWSVSLDVVARMPIPTHDVDHLPINLDVLDPLLDYAQHLALFKEGPAALATSEALVQRFLRAAGVTLSFQQAQQPARRPLVEQSTQNDRTQPDALPVAGGV